MSTPLFIRTPKTFPVAGSSALGHSLAGGPGTLKLLVPEASEATLIESVNVTGLDFSNAAGQLVLVLTEGAVSVVLGAYELPAGTSTWWGSTNIPVNIVVGVGQSLYCSHNVKDSGASYTSVGISAQGGVLR